MHLIFIEFLFSPWEFRSQMPYINICFCWAIFIYAGADHTNQCVCGVQAAGKTCRCDDIKMENYVIGLCLRMLTATDLVFHISIFIKSIKFTFCWQMKKKRRKTYHTHMVKLLQTTFRIFLRHSFISFSMRHNMYYGYYYYYQ